jgi:hypothetical protein
MAKKMPAIAARYNAKILPPDTFDHLMTAAELAIVKLANGK